MNHSAVAVVEAELVLPIPVDAQPGVDGGGIACLTITSNNKYNW